MADWEQVWLIKQVMAGLKKLRENCQRNTTRNNTRILRNQRLQNKMGLIYDDWISCEPAAGDGGEEERSFHRRSLVEPGSGRGSYLLLNLKGKKREKMSVQ